MSKTNGNRKGKQKQSNEEDIDKQLKELGLYEYNSTFVEKKKILAAVLESKGMSQKVPDSDGSDYFEEDTDGLIQSHSRSTVSEPSLGHKLQSKTPDNVGRMSPCEKTGNHTPRTPATNRAGKILAASLNKDEVQKEKAEINPLLLLQMKKDSARKDKAADTFSDYQSPDQNKVTKSRHLLTRALSNVNENGSGKKGKSLASNLDAKIDEPKPSNIKTVNKDEFAEMKARAREFADMLNCFQESLFYPLSVDLDTDNIPEESHDYLLTAEEELRQREEDLPAEATSLKICNAFTGSKNATEYVYDVELSPPSSPSVDLEKVEICSNKTEPRNRRVFKGVNLVDLMAHDDDFVTDVPSAGPSGHQEREGATSRTETKGWDSKVTTVKEGCCPICRHEFPANQLEKHASECGVFTSEFTVLDMDGVVPNQPSSRLTRSAKRSARTPLVPPNESSHGAAGDQAPSFVFTNYIEGDVDTDFPEISSAESDYEALDRNKRTKKQSADLKGKKRRH